MGATGAGAEKSKSRRPPPEAGAGVEAGAGLGASKKEEAFPEGVEEDEEGGGKKEAEELGAWVLGGEAKKSPPLDPLGDGAGALEGKNEVSWPARAELPTANKSAGLFLCCWDDWEVLRWRVSAGDGK